MPKKTYVYIGSWRSNSDSAKGIGIYEYNEETGTMKYVKTVIDTIVIGALYIDKNRDVLYCTDELPYNADNNRGSFGGGGGQALALKIDPETGDLNLISRVPSYGANPSFVATDPESGYLLLTNYGTRDVSLTKTAKDVFGKYRILVEHDESNIVLYPLNPDGTIAEPADIFRLNNEGPEAFQMSSHAHMIQRSPSGRLYAVCDKGGDRVYMFSLDYGNNKLVPLCEPWKSKAGVCPRYCVFHPSLPFLFVDNEDETTVASLRYDETGALEHICTVNSMPDGEPPKHGIIQTDICLDKAGRYVYVLMRVLNMVAVFKLDEYTGELTKIQNVKLPGEGPRGCKVSPDGRFLWVANMDSNSLCRCAIGKDGKLTGVKSVMEHNKPGCITFYRPEEQER